MNLFEQTTQVLEWPRLLDALAGHARSTMGAVRCRAPELATSLHDSRRRQQETTEMGQLQASGEALPTLMFPDIREPLARGKKGAVLEVYELRDCAMVLGLLEESGCFMGRHQHDAPALASATQPLQSIEELRPVKTALDAAIHPDGSIKESATPELRRLTHQAQALKQQIRRELDQMLHSRRYEDILQEQYFAEREGRYVIPVKADMRGRVPGIVHDVSASGATVFLEPRELVELNNSIKVADLEIEREVRRILRELSALVAAQSEVVLAGLDALAVLDGISARALFGRQLKAHPVGLNADGRVRLLQARHPLLVLSKAQVVANDILLDESIHVLVISGPNTGGKTVTLKIVGLFALMVRAGLHLPCDEESEMAVFPDVYADIGDAQDLARDLSSFSAHMTQMIQLLDETDRQRRSDTKAVSRQWLVLLDEPVTSTDPAEGAALAEALLCRLATLGMKVVTTTHYGPLKALAHTMPGFANAAVEFDVATLSPTYRLFMGVPGGSSALEIAGRLGMDRALLDEARQKLDKDERVMETMLHDLQATQRQLAEDLARAVEARREAEQAEQRAKAQVAYLEDTEREAQKGLKRKLSEQFSRARAEVQATVDAVKGEQKLIKAKAAKQRLFELEAQTTAELAPAGTPVPLAQLGVGDQVEISGLGMTGTLLEAPQGKKRVRVKVGEGEVLATVANLVGLARGRTAPSPPVSSSPPRVSSGGGMGLDEQTVVDVRGKAADEALDEVVAALDRATLSAAPFLRIIHGHGTGKLKASLRDYLKDSPYVTEFRAGDRAEGGDGVTVARLR
ncbi:MAG TPA: endonuclease MutS2 [Candidatus Udaeobacter sp.]|nr:endonuclease MutS2 [Candidatus Udaeobacter sp.]